MIILDEFSGIGGMSKGLMEAGLPIDHHYYSEVDKHAVSVYKHKFNNSTHVGSITAFQQWRIERPNIITFGSPCQDFSLAGNRAGLGGNRSSLILAAIETVKRFRPDVFIWENVKGAFSSNAGADFWAILQAFADIGGYRLEWQLLNTSWFLPQNRERIYLVGHLAGRSEPGVFPIGEDYRGITEGATEAPVNCLTAGGHSGGLHSSMTLVTRINKSQDGKVFDVAGISQCLSAGHGNTPKIQVKSGVKRGFEEASIGDSINLQNPNFKTRKGRVGKGVAQTLDTAGSMAVVQPVQIGQSQQTFAAQHGTIIGDQNQDAFTLRSSQPNGVKIDTQIRRLTEIECERLQGFPDDWTKYGLYNERPTRKDLLHREKNPELWAYHTKAVGDGYTLREISRTQRYKMLGNAVSVPVVKAIGQRLKLIGN